MKENMEKIIKWSEKYMKTDMTYVAKGGFWVLVKKTGLIIASFLTMLAFGNWLPKEAFGTYQYIMSATVIAGIFTLQGINTSMIKSISQGMEGTFWSATKERFRWSLIGSTGLLIGAGWYFFAGNMVLAAGFLIAAIFMPGEKILEMFDSFWNGRKNFRELSKNRLLAVFFSLLTLIPAVYLTDNIIIILLTYFVSHVIFEGIFYLKTLRSVRNNKIDVDAVPFGKDLTMIHGIGKVADHLDKVIVWQFLGPVQVAIYSFAILPIYKISGILPVSALALPKLSEIKIDNESKKGIWSKFFKLFLLFIPIGILLALTAPLIYDLFFPKYVESVIYFQALTILAVINGPLSLLDSALISETKTKFLYIINTIHPSMKIILFLCLVPFYGIWGMVFSILTAQLARGILLLFYFAKI